MNSRDPVDQWMIDMWGFEADGQTPNRERPPAFLTDDGTFDIEGYEKWVGDQRRYYETLDGKTNKRA